MDKTRYELIRILTITSQINDNQTKLILLGIANRILKNKGITWERVIRDEFKCSRDEINYDVNEDDIFEYLDYELEYEGLQLSERDMDFYCSVKDKYFSHVDDEGNPIGLTFKQFKYLYEIYKRNA